MAESYFFNARTDDSVAYDAGPGVFSVTSLCFLSYLTGSGSSSAFTAALKACK
jgi:hypothetical protein